MATNQVYKEYRVLSIPTGALSPGDKYYLYLDGYDSGKYETWIINDSGVAVAPASYPKEDKVKLSGIAEGAQVNPLFKTIANTTIIGSNIDIPVATINGQSLIGNNTNIVLPSTSAGAATTSTPEEPDTDYSYNVTNTTETDVAYPNFGGVVVPAGKTGIMVYNTSASEWEFQDSQVSIDGLLKAGPYTGTGADINVKATQAQTKIDSVTLDGGNQLDKSKIVGSRQVQTAGTLATNPNYRSILMSVLPNTEYTYKGFSVLYVGNEYGLGASLDTPSTFNATTKVASIGDASATKTVFVWTTGADTYFVALNITN